MSINLLSCAPRSERRLRLLFDNQPAAGAFTSTSFYTVSSVDNLTSQAPSVNASLVVSGSPNSVELSISQDLVMGSIYQITVTNMPCIDSSVCNGSLQFNLATDFSIVKVNQEVVNDDYAQLLYGVDLLHDGVDFVEDSSGDLATFEGLANVQQAIRRRLLGETLPWDPSWGANARGYVDSTAGDIPNLRAALVKQALSDDRVKTAFAKFMFDPNNPQVTFDVYLTLVGGETVSPIDVKVLG